jgi:hypothetical protein
MVFVAASNEQTRQQAPPSCSYLAALGSASSKGVRLPAKHLRHA